VTKTTGKKRAAQKAWGLEESLEIPLVVVPSPDAELIGIFDEILDAVVAVGLQVALVDADKSHSERLAVLQNRHPGHIAVVTSTEAADAAGDIEVLSELDDQAKARYGESPLVPVAGKGVEAFDPIAETGFGFDFETKNPWSLLVALVRASETFRFPYDWKNLLRAVKKVAVKKG